MFSVGLENQMLFRTKESYLPINLLWWVILLLLFCVQEEYRAEGISWRMIDYIDNTSCINLISKKPTALLHLLDEECKWVTDWNGFFTEQGWSMTHVGPESKKDLSCSCFTSVTFWNLSWHFVHCSKKVYFLHHYILIFFFFFFHHQGNVLK